jgi:hypothetical protein
MEEVRTLKETLEATQRQVQSLLEAGGKQEQVQSTFEQQKKELTKKLEDGDISMAEWGEEYSKLLESGTQQRIESYLSQQNRESEAKRLQDEFLKTNADFVELRDGGELEPIIAANPLHDNLSAYYAHKAQMAEQAKEAAVKEAVTKAVKDTEERLRKEFTSKRNAASLGESAAHVPNAKGIPAELQDTKRFGGTNQVLANRLRAMREARA